MDSGKCIIVYGEQAFPGIIKGFTGSTESLNSISDEEQREGCQQE